MTWQILLNQNRVERYLSSKQEIDDLRNLVGRNLKDAALPGLSFDNKLGISYEAGLILAKMVIACCGYRVKGNAHHRTTFEILPLALGDDAHPIADFFEQCRRNRNLISYDVAGIVGKREADEALREVRKFQRTVEQWISEKYPAFNK